MASSSPHHGKDDKKGEPLLDLDNEEEGGASRNSLQAGEVDIQEWERRLASGNFLNLRFRISNFSASMVPWRQDRVILLHRLIII